LAVRNAEDAFVPTASSVGLPGHLQRALNLDAEVAPKADAPSGEPTQARANAQQDVTQSRLERT
jgi:hypothetical protein